MGRWVIDPSDKLLPDGGTCAKYINCERNPPRSSDDEDPGNMAAEDDEEDTDDLRRFVALSGSSLAMLSSSGFVLRFLEPGPEERRT